MTEIVAQSWSQLQDCLFDDSWNPSLHRYRSQEAFRGLSNADYRLATTLARLGGPYDVLEHHLLRNFRKYAVRSVVERDSLWHWLSVAQHYGLPTRLLDWTFSPYVALHFATANEQRFDVDGAVWAVDYGKLKEHLPPQLKAKMATEGSDLFTVEMLSDTVATLEEFRGLSDAPFALFFEPPSIDDRIVNQSALFSLMSDVHVLLDGWLEDHSGLWRKVLIPAELKPEIRDKLDQSNVTERVLFPGLDGLSRWLKRHYSPIKSAPPKLAGP